MKRLRDIDAVREQIRAASPLEEVIPERYSIEVHGTGPESRKIVCPFHDDTDPSLGISLLKQVFYCHGCEESGDVFTFVQLMENLSHIAALRALAEQAGIDLAEYEEDPTPEDLKRLELLNTVEEVTAWAEGNRTKTFQKWADSRRLDPAILEEYRVGYATRVPPVDGDPKLELDQQGRWKGRVVVPLRDDRGRPVAFRTRATGDKGIKVMGPSEGYPLEVPPIYGFPEARQHIREADGLMILVEGEPDVWQMAAHGYRNVCGTFGTHLTKEAAQYLHERGVRRVVVLPDADEAGRRFALRVSKFRYPGLHISIAILDTGDPDEVLLRDPEEVESALAGARHALEYAIESTLRGRPLDGITEKMDALHELEEVVRELPEYERALAVKVLADRFDMSEEGLTDYFREATEPDQLHNIQAERMILSAAMDDEEFMGEVVLELKEGDFYLLKHRQMFSAMARLFRLRDDVSRETVSLYLRNKGNEATARYVDQLEEVTRGERFLLADVRDKAVRRQTRDKASDLLTRIADTSVESNVVLSSFSADLSQIVVGSGERMKDISDVVRVNTERMHQRIANPEYIVGLDLGPEWRVLNRTIHGLQEGMYMVLAAPTGDGKSAVAMSWARRIAVDLNEPTLYLTHEMSEESLETRMRAAVSGVEIDKIVTGYLTEEEVELVHDAGQQIAASPLQITTRGRVYEEALALIRHDIIRRGVKAVFVDYIQLMGMADPRGVARHQELGIISKGFLDLCQETGVRIIALAQINREGSKKTRTGTGDTGESYKIPQDSDIFYVVKKKEGEEIEAEGVERGNRYGFLDKHRHGRDKVGCDIQADMATMRIKEVHDA